MRPESDSLAAAVRAYREASGQASPLDATRARVLAEADRARRAPLANRRLATGLGLAVLVALGSAAAARTELARLWHPPVAITWSPLRATEVTPGSRGRALVIPPVPADGDGEQAEAAQTAAYARAHRAHFADGHPAAALAAWDRYLRDFPDGAFAPEARFNRAVCLIRLGRFGDADRALAPVAEGRFGAYRRDDAARLRDWLRDRRARAVLSGAPRR